jgi:hypothetical protein
MRYIPILKGKAGELKALANLKQETAKVISPLVEFPPVPVDFVEGQEEPVAAKTIDQHVASVSKALADNLTNLSQLYVDGLYLELEDDLASGQEPSAALFAALRDANVQFVPVCGLDRNESYIASVAECLAKDGRGLCLRITEADLEGTSELQAQIDAILTALSASPEQTDLVLDFGAKVPAKSALPFQIHALPHLEAWRSFTVAASSFPIDMSNVPRNTLVEMDRAEWGVWNSLRSKTKTLTRMPDYGDYGINHPEIVEIDPRLMRQSPNIRYTSEASFVIAKGAAYPRKKDKAKFPGLTPAEQFPKLAAGIIKHASWKKPEFSWGDSFIQSCSEKKCVGSPTDWRAVGTSHHISLVVQQLANLPELES